MEDIGILCDKKTLVMLEGKFYTFKFSPLYFLAMIIGSFFNKKDRFSISEDLKMHVWLF